MAGYDDIYDARDEEEMTNYVLNIEGTGKNITGLHIGLI